MSINALKSAILVAAGLVAGPCLAETTVTQKDLGSAVPHCNAPVASIIIGKFPCKASSCTAPPQTAPGMAGVAMMMAMAGRGQAQTLDLSRLGEGMSSALTSGLKATGCFDVQEREAMEDLQKEAELSGVKLQAKPSDFMISGAITAVDVSSKSSSFGGGMIPLVGAVSNTTHSAKLSLDVRIIDVKKASILESRTFEANSAKSNWGVAGAGFSGRGALFGAMSSTQSPELDGVANQSVLYAVNYITETVAKDAIVSRPAPAPASH